MRRKPRLSHNVQREFLGSGETKDFIHIQIFLLHVPTQTPSKSVQQIGQARLNNLQPKAVPRAHPPSRPERQELEVLPFHVDGLSHEPLWAKLVWVLPHCWVPPDGPHIHQHSSAFRYVVPCYFAILSAHSRH